MSKKEKKTVQYSFVYDMDTGLVTKQNLETGASWTYPSRPKAQTVSHVARNGVSVAKLQAAGHNVRVKHLRWAIYWGQNSLLINRKKDSSYRTIVVPSTFRKDPNYMLLPKGGYTHVVIKTPEGEYVCVSSECAVEDPFCYNAGVATALERLSKEDIKKLNV